MADELSDWSAESSNAVHISLVTPATGGPKTLHTFHPKFTYPIFGDEERIFGYQGLKINLRYNASDMRPGLQIMYNKKFKTVGETSPTDLKTVLEPYLPKNAFEKSSVFDAAISDASHANWHPPGELLNTIESGDHTYEIWKGSLADPAVRQMVKRIQILVSFYIEGGTPIELEDADWSLERWTVFLLYEKKTVDVPEGTSPYILVGYSTVYRYFYYQPLPSSSPPSAKKQRVSHPANLDFKLPISNPDDYAFSSLPCRTRISQFIILPPFQGTGSGSRLYNTIFAHYLALPQTIEITVEDPNEAFDDLRDLNDLTLLRTIPAFLSIKINTTATPRPKGPAPNDIVDSEKLEAIRKSMKIAPRQFYRVVEMHLLSLIPPSVRQSLIQTPETSSKAGVEDLKIREKEYRLWLLWVKKRLYRHNKIMLAQLDRAERIEKLEQAVGGVEADYARLLRALDGRGKGKGKDLGVGEASSSGNGIGKRGTPMSGVEEEDEDEPTAKKVKFAS